MAVEKIRWQRELSDAGDELSDARATILKHSDRIRELERGYSLLPNPAESKLRVEIGNLRAELEAYKRDLPTALELLNELLKRRKKSDVREVDIEIILEILGDDKPE